MTIETEALARIDAALADWDAYVDSGAPVEARIGSKMELLRAARALIPEPPACQQCGHVEGTCACDCDDEPPTDDEREALCEIIDAVDEGRIDGQVELWENIFPLERDQIVDAIMASPVWRNRGRGPITDTPLTRVRIDDLRRARDAVSGALAHRMHHVDPDMFFLAVKQLLDSIWYLTDGYGEGAEEENRTGGTAR